MSTFPVASSELTRAHLRLAQLRWGMLLLSCLALGFCAWQSMQMAWLPLIQALATLGLINLGLRVLQRQQLAALWLVRLGLLADVLALSEVLLFSGGAANPLASLYLPPVLFAALLSPGLFAWGLTLATMLIYGALFFWHLPWPLAQYDAAYAFSAHQLGMWLTFALSALLMTGFISYLSRQITVRDNQLLLAREAQLRDEQLLALGMQAAVAAHALSTPLNTLSLLVDELRDTSTPSLADAELNLMQGQLRVCREALTRLKHQAQTGVVRVTLFASLTERLLGWRALRPDVTLQWRAPPGADPCVWLDSTFWPALFNLINNAAEAGGGEVAIEAEYVGGQLLLRIVNRDGCLTAAQLAAAGLSQVSSTKVAGLGLGVMLSHATLARLGGSLSLDNQATGGVCACIALPLKEST
jgi:two-component system sensor histidine kinase RegB